jgi:peptidoglycan hydrolase CwlO-like protein
MDRTILWKEAHRLVQSRQWEASLAVFEDILRSHPKDAKAAYSKGIAHARLGQLEQARAQTSRALEVQPDYPLARRALAVIEASLVASAPGATPIATPSPAPPPTDSTTPAPPAPLSSFKVVLVLAVAVLVIAGAGAAVFLTNSKETPQAERPAARVAPTPSRIQGRVLLSEPGSEAIPASAAYVWIVEESESEAFLRRVDGLLKAADDETERAVEQQEKDLQSRHEQAYNRVQEALGKAEETEKVFQSSSQELEQLTTKYHGINRTLEDLKAREAEVSDEFEKFKQPGWNLFQVNSFPPAQTATRNDVEMYTRMYESELQRVVKGRESTQALVDETMKTGRALTEEVNEAKSDLENVREEVRKAEEDVARIEQSLQRIREGDSEFIQSAWFNSIKGLYENLNQVEGVLVHTRCDSDGRFSCEDPKVACLVFAAYVSEDSSTLTLWEYESGSKQKELLLDADSISNRFAAPLGRRVQGEGEES